MAAYFNKNLRILRRALEKKRGRVLDFEFLSAISDFPRLKLQQWERDGDANLAELRKLAQFYSRVLETEITVDQICNRDLRYDKRFSKIIS